MNKYIRFSGYFGSSTLCLLIIEFINGFFGNHSDYVTETFILLLVSLLLYLVMGKKWEQ